MGKITLSNCVQVDLSLSKLSDHPDNPRTDLGDLSELTESIKKHGLFQPIVVINGEGKDNYTILIGHRRAQAAREAGLTEVPCKVCFDDLDKQTQILIMLEENMQRDDLTAWEQGQSFQMCLDLGQSMEEIKQKSGFSESTIRKRCKIAQLDPDGVKTGEHEWGMTLADWAELNSIADVDTRNELLKNANSRQGLMSSISSKKAEIKRKEDFELYFLPTLKGYGAEEGNNMSEWHSDVEVVVKARLSECGLDAEACRNIEKVKGKIFYKLSWSDVIVMTKKEPKKMDDTKEKEKAAAKERVEEAKKQLNALEADLKSSICAHIKEVILPMSKDLKESQELQMIKDVFNVSSGCSLNKKFMVCGKYDITSMWQIKDDDERLNEEYSVIESLLYIICYYVMSMWLVMDGKRQVDKCDKIKPIIDYCQRFGYKIGNERVSLLSGVHDAYDVVANKGKL